MHINPRTEFAAMPLEQHVAYRVSNIEEDQRDVTRSPEKTEQRDKGIDTRDIDSSYRHRSKSCVKLRLCCLRLCRAKKRCSKRVLRKPRRVLERIKARSKECGKPDDTVAVAGVSTTPHRESISHRDAPRKSRKSRKQDETVEVADKDVSKEDDTKERRKERRKREREERKAMTEEERRRREEHPRVPHPVDARLVAREDDLVVEDRVPVKPPSIADFAKSCCYLCAQTTLAIAAASRPERSDKSVQVSAHKFPAETFPTFDKSCSPMLLVRTVQSSVRVRTRETGTLCYPAGARVAPRGETGPRAKKRKKFALFPGLTRTKCPAGRHAACETDKSTAGRDDNAEKREPRNERCCRERNA